MNIPALSASAVPASIFSQSSCPGNIYTPPAGLFSGGQSPFVSMAPGNNAWTGALIAPLNPLSQAISTIAQTIHGFAGSPGFPQAGQLQPGIEASNGNSLPAQILGGLGGLAGGSFMDLFGGIAGALFQQFDIKGIISDLAGGAKDFFSKLF